MAYERFYIAYWYDDTTSDDGTACALWRVGGPKADHWFPMWNTTDGLTATEDPYSGVVEWGKECRQLRSRESSTTGC